MNGIGCKIRKIREEKGISQEAMAMELGLTQSNYGRLEKDDSRLNVPKLERIAKVLDLKISFLFGENPNKIINQKNNKNPNAYVENLYHTNKEVYHLEERILRLEQELASIRKSE